MIVSCQKDLLHQLRSSPTDNLPRQTLLKPKPPTTLMSIKEQNI